eukprot:TRINITY_DN5925_c1_g1_i1.p1 TRINITY_DN5925_c1_g1~~TRINITY_DN5925_c1_g1_i1.p1  ORF type:complete len:172 (-),score=10.20 TRINITY_DN5925_c1_g1_i1:67-582(-)
MSSEGGVRKSTRKSVRPDQYKPPEIEHKKARRASSDVTQKPRSAKHKPATTAPPSAAPAPEPVEDGVGTTDHGWHFYADGHWHRFSRVVASKLDADWASGDLKAPDQPLANKTPKGKLRISFFDGMLPGKKNQINASRGCFVEISQYPEECGQLDCDTHHPGYWAKWLEQQ